MEARRVAALHASLRAQPPELRVSGPALRYEMTLEPMRLPLLPLLEMTPDAPSRAAHRRPERDCGAATCSGSPTAR